MTTDTAVDIQGLIVSEKHAGNGKREILLQETSSSNASSVTVLLDGATTNNKWFTVKKARNLLCAGVELQVNGYLEQDNTIYATSIAIACVHPSKQYLARLLAFSLDQLHILFSSGNDDHQEKESLPTNLIKACAPISRNELQQVHEYCQEQRMEGRGAALWKTLPIENLSTKLYQNAHAMVQPKLRNLKIPRVSNASLQSVQRLEALYLRLPSDGTVEQYTFDETTQSYVVSDESHAIPRHVSMEHYGDYDPSLNLPNPNDTRRLTYVEQRKRPQVQWMLHLVQQWTETTTRTTNEERMIHVVDIGGGRGYFGIAVAGFFSNMKVTVVDCNPSSLQAGEASAKDAGLVDKMDFIYCDLNDSAQVQELLGKQEFDLVLGLHCCGGLAEAAVELAIQCQADFIVSTCCFRSNPELASLTRLAQECRMQSTSEEITCDEYQQDVSRVAALAVTVGGKEQHSAIRAYNGMRLVAAEARFKALYTDLVLKTWQETFPVEYSVQNRVMMGTIVQQQQ